MVLAPHGTSPWYSPTILYTPTILSPLPLTFLREAAREATIIPRIRLGLSRQVEQMGEYKVAANQRITGSSRGIGSFVARGFAADDSLPRGQGWGEPGRRTR
jgi:hypothetical protein